MILSGHKYDSNKTVKLSNKGQTSIKMSINSLNLFNDVCVCVCGERL